ncbi:hypothetical protein LIER_16358 [Lithospermum erythrorhizon]|uniref:Uncharacterized protein n=1 Tax=Lithospermum erythrorhizon TaxID=34254 RepID=A0AAV3QBQ2_LITER
MKNLGMLKYFLGFEVARSQEGLFLSQRKLNMPWISFLKQDCWELCLGFDIWFAFVVFAFTRPDLSYAVQASCHLTRRSVSGWIVFLDSSSVSWKTKKQVTVSRSFTEVEYCYMASLTCELKWLKEQIGDLFTKSLGRKQFEFLLCKLSIRDLYAPT